MFGLGNDAELEGAESDKSEDEYLAVANAFAAKRKAAKERAVTNVRRSFTADQDKTYEQRLYAAELKQSKLREVESHEDWVRWNPEQEKNSLVFGCIGPGASWASCVAKLSADQAQGSKASQADQAAEVPAGGHVKDADRGLRRRGATSGATTGANSKATQAGQAAEVSAGDHVKVKARDLRRRRRRRRRKDDVSSSSFGAWAKG